MDVTLLTPGPVRETVPDEHEQSLVDKLIPDFLWISTDYTAKLSLDALERNKMRVVPGVTSKAISVASGYAPLRDRGPQADRRRGLQRSSAATHSPVCLLSGGAGRCRRCCG